MHRFVWYIAIFSLTLVMACSGSVVQEKQAITKSQAPAQTAQGQAAQANAPSVKELKDYELQMVADGGALKPLKLSQTVGQGKVVVIDFWATWCKPCLVSIPDLVALHNEYKDKGVEIYGLSIEDPEEGHRTDPTTKNLQAVISMSKNLKINYRVGFAPDTMFAAFDQARTGGIPQTFIFGKDGTLIDHLSGFHPANTPKKIRASIDKALNS